MTMKAHRRPVSTCLRFAVGSGGSVVRPAVGRSALACRGGILPAWSDELRVRPHDGVVVIIPVLRSQLCQFRDDLVVVEVLVVIEKARDWLHLQQRIVRAE